MPSIVYYGHVADTFLIVTYDMQARLEYQNYGSIAR